MFTAPCIHTHGDVSSGFFQWKVRSLSSTFELGLMLWIAFADGIQGRWRYASDEAKP